MIDKSQEKQFSGGEMIPRGITIHNTNNELDANENYNLMINSMHSYSAHFFVDSKIVIQAMPLDIQAFHTGKAYDDGNRYTIAVEICSRGSEAEFCEAVENTVQLIILLREKLGNLPIYFHNDFDRLKYCPHRILDIYGNKKNFIRRYGL